jgi:mannose-6-phosphate isomerase
MKVVNKPWGREIWLELNDRYCYKRVYVRAAHRTSLQRHLLKLETNYVIEGEAEVWLEDDSGVIRKSRMTKDDVFTIHPRKAHRVVAVTDLILQEVSTPEVDDVVRLEDDTGRPDGRIESEHVGS